MASLTKFEVHFVTLIRGHWTQLQLNFVRFATADTFAAHGDKMPSRDVQGHCQQATSLEEPPEEHLRGSRHRRPHQVFSRALTAVKTASFDDRLVVPRTESSSSRAQASDLTRCSLEP